MNTAAIYAWRDPIFPLSGKRFGIIQSVDLTPNGHTDNRLDTVAEYAFSAGESPGPGVCVVPMMHLADHRNLLTLETDRFADLWEAAADGLSSRNVPVSRCITDHEAISGLAYARDRGFDGIPPRSEWPSRTVSAEHIMRGIVQPLRRFYPRASFADYSVRLGDPNARILHWDGTIGPVTEGRLVHPVVWPHGNASVMYGWIKESGRSAIPDPRTNLQRLVQWYAALDFGRPMTIWTCPYTWVGNPGKPQIWRESPIGATLWLSLMGLLRLLGTTTYVMWWDSSGVRLADFASLSMMLDYIEMNVLQGAEPVKWTAYTHEADIDRLVQADVLLTDGRVIRPYIDAGGGQLDYA